MCPQITIAVVLSLQHPKIKEKQASAEQVVLSCVSFVFFVEKNKHKTCCFSWIYYIK